MNIYFKGGSGGRTRQGQRDNDVHLTHVRSSRAKVAAAADDDKGYQAIGCFGRLKYIFAHKRSTTNIFRFVNLLVKLTTCVLYGYREWTDCHNYDPNDQGDMPKDVWEVCNTLAVSLNESEENGLPTSTHDENGDPHWATFFQVLLWVDRSGWLWLVQTIVACVSLVLTFLHVAVRYQGNILQSIFHQHIIVDLVSSFPFLITIPVYRLRHLFIPAFFNCWLVKALFLNIYRDMGSSAKKRNILAEQLLDLACSFACVLFAGSCGMSHLQRAGLVRMNLFESFYFLMVVFSTVGFGDYSPDYWASRLYIIILIGVALSIVTSMLDQLGTALAEKRRSGGTYSSSRAKREKHVVLSINENSAEIVNDFLMEFYSDYGLTNYYVILLIPCDIDHETSMLINQPIYQQRVIFMRGSVLKAGDLARAQVKVAEGVFILSARCSSTSTLDRDRRTVMRSWAVKDYAPTTLQFVSFVRPRTMMHLKHADFTICEHEFKYSMLANNCICPGMSTFLTVILHTSDGTEGQTSKEQWHKIYGKHSGNELYSIKCSRSKWFGEYEGQSFTHASVEAHKKHGCCLTAVKTDILGADIQLNPGSDHILKGTDTLYYYAITREEHFADGNLGGVEVDEESSASSGPLMIDAPTDTATRGKPMDVSRLLEERGARSNRSKSRGSTVVGDDTRSEVISEDSRDSRHRNRRRRSRSGCSRCSGECVKDSYVKGTLPVTPYIGSVHVCCYLWEKRKSLCCLNVGDACEHNNGSTAYDYDWSEPAIILAADKASNGMYNFIVPLRAHYRDPHKLNPIVMLLEQPPAEQFADMFAWFPLVYYMIGSFDNLTDLLKAGVCTAKYVVVLNKVSGMTAGDGDDEYGVDAQTILSVETASRLFPNCEFINELTFYENMRFMHFDPTDEYTLEQSEIEEREENLGSNMAFIFRLPFAAGNVFSASMMDTLLYQSFRKDYLVKYCRLLLGVDESPGSGYLEALHLDRDTMRDLRVRSFGQLYQLLCDEGAVPIGLYRTQKHTTIAETVEDNPKEEVPVAVGSEDPEAVFAANTKRKILSLKDPRFLHLTRDWEEIVSLVKYRMQMLKLPSDDYVTQDEDKGYISYVIVNPSASLQLVENDIAYVLRPAKPVDTPKPKHSDSHHRRKKSSDEPGPEDVVHTTTSF